MPPKPMTIEEIREQCESLSNEQLLLVVNNKRLYNERIVGVAYQEIRKRGLSRQEVKEIEKKHNRREQIIKGDIREDIFFLEKIGLFVLCIPRFAALIGRDYRRKGYMLKTWQAWYFNILGLPFAILSIFIGKAFHSPLTAISTWAASFVLVYLSNNLYFKKKIVNHLAARSVDPDSETK